VGVGVRAWAWARARVLARARVGLRAWPRARAGVRAWAWVTVRGGVRVRAWIRARARARARGGATLLAVVNLGALLGLRLVVVGKGAVLLLLRLDRPAVLHRAAPHAHAVAMAHVDVEDGGRVGRSALRHLAHHQRAGRGGRFRHHVWRGDLVRVVTNPRVAHGRVQLRRLAEDVVEQAHAAEWSLGSRAARWLSNRLVPRVVEDAILREVHAVALLLYRACRRVAASQRRRAS